MLVHVDAWLGLHVNVLVKAAVTILDADEVLVTDLFWMLCFPCETLAVLLLVGLTAVVSVDRVLLQETVTVIV